MWKQKRKGEGNDRKGQHGTAAQFKSQLERVYNKEKRGKEIEGVKQQARKEVKAELSKNIHNIVMMKLNRK